MRKEIKKVTLEDLIKRLKSDESAVGGLLETWIAQYRNLVKRCAKCDYTFPHAFQILNGRKQQLFYKIFGLIWGVNGAGAITDGERNELHDELCAIGKEEVRANESEKTV